MWTPSPYIDIALITQQKDLSLMKTTLNDDLKKFKLFKNLKADAHPTKIEVGIVSWKIRLENQKLGVHFDGVTI